MLIKTPQQNEAEEMDNHKFALIYFTRKYNDTEVAYYCIYDIPLTLKLQDEAKAFVKSDCILASRQLNESYGISFPFDSGAALFNMTHGGTKLIF